MTVRTLIVVIATPTMASTTNQPMHSFGENAASGPNVSFCVSKEPLDILLFSLWNENTRKILEQ